MAMSSDGRPVQMLEEMATHYIKLPNTFTDMTEIILHHLSSTYLLIVLGVKSNDSVCVSQPVSQLVYLTSLSI